MIEKAFKRSPQLDTEEIVFEYAMCLACAEKMRETLSQESKQRVDGFFFSRYMSHAVRQEDPNKQVEQQLEQCWFTGEQISELSEYHIVGLCRDNKMLSDQVMSMGMTALDQVQELLSPETKDELDRFIDDITGLPPEWQEALFQRKGVLI